MGGRQCGVQVTAHRGKKTVSVFDSSIDVCDATFGLIEQIRKFSRLLATEYSLNRDSRSSRTPWLNRYERVAHDPFSADRHDRIGAHEAMQFLFKPKLQPELGGWRAWYTDLFDLPRTHAGNLNL
jgi:hypothetical protein